MIWLVNGKESISIQGINTHFKEATGMYQLWATKSTGTALLVFESKDEADVKELKEAIDYAVQIGETAFSLERE